MKNMIFAFVILLGSIVSFAAQDASHAKASVDFANLKDGDTVKSPFKVKMAVTGYKIRKAGEDTKDQTTGHHHILVDQGPVAKGQAIANDETHLHFGKGQTETEVTLKPGEHTLTLQLADGAHLSYGPELSKTVKIIVK